MLANATPGGTVKQMDQQSPIKIELAWALTFLFSSQQAEIWIYLLTVEKSLFK